MREEGNSESIEEQRERARARERERESGGWRNLVFFRCELRPSHTAHLLSTEDSHGQSSNETNGFLCISSNQT